MGRDLYTKETATIAGHLLKWMGSLLTRLGQFIELLEQGQGTSREMVLPAPGKWPITQILIGLSWCLTFPSVMQACLLKVYKPQVLKRRGCPHRVVYSDVQGQWPLARHHSKVSLWQQKPIKMCLASSV